MIDVAWSDFTPWSALAGGLLIGLAPALFLLLDGRLARLSGLFGGLPGPPARGRPLPVGGPARAPRPPPRR